MLNQSDKLEKQFFSDGYNLGINSTSKEKLYTALHEMYSAIDQFIISLTAFAERENRKIHCISGCEWCCHQPVFALSFELDYLNTHLKKTFSPKKQAEISERAKLKLKATKSLEGRTLLCSKYPCPLLFNSKCISYEARPVACRIYLSTDKTSCINFYRSPEDENNFPALLNLPMRFGRMMNEGFKSALKVNGIQSEEFRIEEKLLS